MKLTKIQKDKIEKLKFEVETSQKLNDYYFNILCEELKINGDENKIDWLFDHVYNDMPINKKIFN